MKKSTIKIRFASFISLIIFLGFAFFYIFIFTRCFFAVKNVPMFPEHPIMRVMIYGSSRESVSARFTLLDTSGKEFAIFDKSWSGQSLTVEFSSAEFSNRKFIFPLRIYAADYFSSRRTSVYEGTKLSRYYMDDDGECSILDARFPKKARKALFSLAYFAIFQSKKFQSKYSKIYSLSLAGLENGITYEISDTLRFYRM